MREGILPRNKASAYHGSDPHHRILCLRPSSVTHATTTHPHSHVTNKELRS